MLKFLTKKSKLNTLPAFVCLVFAYFIALGVFSSFTKHFPYGDGFEYVMMTESFINHYSPDLRPEDAQKYESYLDQRGLEVFKRGNVEVAKNIRTEKDRFIGYFRAFDNGQYYSYHFWTYSLFAVPFRLLLESLDADIRLTALMTNLFFIFLGIWLILGLKKYANYQKIFLALLFLFSPQLWYIDWAHSEILTGVFSFLAVLYYFEGKKYMSLFLFSIATTQAQPLVIPTFFIFLEVWWNNKTNWKAYFKLFISCIWIIIPLIYYYLHFGRPSINSGGGYTSWSNIHPTRLFSFFFDFNQGMIIGIPLILIALLFLIPIDLIRKKFFKPYLFILSIVLMSCLFMTTGNWNHGSSVINRYTIWCISLIIPVFFIRILEFKKTIFVAVCSLVIIFQAFLIFSLETYQKIYWHANHYTKLSKYFFYHHPNLYNPEPQIVLGRNHDLEVSTTDSILVISNEENEIQKFMVREGSIFQLEKRGVSREALEEFNKDLNYYQSFAFINKPDFEQLGYQQENDTLINFIDRNKEQVFRKKAEKKIKDNLNWFVLIQKKAQKNGMDIDSALAIETKHLYQLKKESYRKEKILSEK